jgi:glycolate oxidase FAD binding subunit
MVFKFNDLKYKGSFLALRIEGDKISIDEKLKQFRLDCYKLPMFKSDV